MLYPQEKERSHRFMLALRTGLPLFFLAAILTFARISDYIQNIPISFFILALIILTVSIYFIFYMIYRGFDEQITDPITHTFTRSKLLSILKEEIEENSEYSIVMVSIDNLSDINARYGTKQGDQVLRVVSKEVGKFFMSKGFDKFPIGHFNGGNFLLGLKGDIGSVRPFLEMMYIKFDDYVMNDIEVKIKGSIVDKGLSSDVNALCERLFEAKETEHEEDDEEKAVADYEDISLLELQENVKHAISKKSLSLMFQPIQSQESVVQVSVKLQGKNDKIIHQKSFMPVVKRLGYEREYDELVLERVLHISKVLKDIAFAFNISPSVLRNRRFMYRFKQMVEKEGVDYKRLIIFLSENEVYANMERYNDLLQEYRALGVRFVLDNIGSLNASVEYLKRLEVDIIRFDKPFSKHMESSSYRALVKGYKTMADEMGIKSWIKMVDTPELKHAFEEMKMDYIQGNIVSKIVNYEKLKEEL